jgi:hypothetical protein
MSIPSNPNPVSGNGRFAASNIPIGSVAYASVGTNTADVNGQLWITDIWIPFSKAITKIGFLQGGTATTDNFLVAIYDSTGTLLGNSNTAGVVSGDREHVQGSDALEHRAGLWAGAVLDCHPGQRHCGRSHPDDPHVDLYRRAHDGCSGTFGTVPASITLPTTFTAGNGPIVYVK